MGGGNARLQAASSSLFQPRPGSGSSNSSSLRPHLSKDPFDKDDPARTDDDNEPPGPAPSSRPCSPSTALGSSKISSSYSSSKRSFTGCKLNVDKKPGLIGDPVVASRLSNHSHAGAALEPLASGRRLRLENERLVAEVARLRRLLLTGAARGGASGEDAALIEDEARYVALEMELQHTREALHSMKADRKRLRAEKFDLLNQMKALYGTLEDKERELRDFIRNYEQVRVCLYCVMILCSIYIYANKRFAPLDAAAANNCIVRVWDVSDEANAAKRQDRERASGTAAPLCVRWPLRRRNGP